MLASPRIAGIVPRAMSVDIPNYRLVERLGEGANSAIYRARNMRNGKDYAVKVVKIVKPEDASFVDLLKAEHNIAAAIDHPVVRKVYELRMLRQRLRIRGAALFMEFVDGWSMAAREFHRPLTEILGHFISVADGLHAMHQAGYVHADLKPNNIMVTPDNAVKLIDLGQSAKINEAKVKIQGTENYIAPEQVSRGILDARTDVFGVGATLHMLLTGKAIKTELNRITSVTSTNFIGRLVSQHVDDQARDLPVCVARLIGDCCKSKQDDRINDMPSLVKRIELARTIVLRHTDKTGEPAHVPDEAERVAELVEADEDSRDFSFDAIAEELGLEPDDTLKSDKPQPSGD